VCCSQTEAMLKAALNEVIKGNISLFSAEIGKIYE
jgi:hypothetical protein